MEASTHTYDASAGSGWGRLGRRLAIGIATLIALISVIGGLALVAAHFFVRDGDGYFSAGREDLATKTSALVVDDIDLSGDRGGIDIEDLPASLRVEVASSNGGSTFVGIARQDDVSTYLARADHTVVEDFGDGKPIYRSEAGSGRVAAPVSRDIWVAQSAGVGEQTVEWDAKVGHWAAVAMNPDASKGVEVTARPAIGIGWLIWVGLGCIAFGGLIAWVTWLVASQGRKAG